MTTAVEASRVEREFWESQCWKDRFSTWTDGLNRTTDSLASLSCFPALWSRHRIGWLSLVRTLTPRGGEGGREGDAPSNFATRPPWGPFQTRQDNTWISSQGEHAGGDRGGVCYGWAVTGNLCLPARLASHSSDEKWGASVRCSDLGDSVRLWLKTLVELSLQISCIIFLAFGSSVPGEHWKIQKCFKNVTS